MLCLYFWKGASGCLKCDSAPTPSVDPAFLGLSHTSAPPSKLGSVSRCNDPLSCVFYYYYYYDIVYDMAVGLLSVCLTGRQRSELEDLRRQLEENKSLAERTLQEELEKMREEHHQRHQVTQSKSQIITLSAWALGSLLIQCTVCD